MTIKTYIIEGVFHTEYKTDDFELELNLPKYALKIKGLSKKLLIEKKSKLGKEQAIYILEGPNSCYVGQSTDIQSRINNHKDKNKSDFSRCFILSKNDTDLRGYLDYMESYAIREMELLGYRLDNSKRPNPDDDILPHYKKDMAKDWIDDFLSFLPILGFKKSPNPLPTGTQAITSKTVNDVISLKLHGNLITGSNNREVFSKLLYEIGLNVIEKQCSSFFDSAFTLSKIYHKPKYGSCHELQETNQKYYLYLNISKKVLIKKIIKIRDMLKLKIEIL